MDTSTQVAVQIILMDDGPTKPVHPINAGSDLLIGVVVGLIVYACLNGIHWLLSLAKRWRRC